MTSSRAVVLSLFVGLVAGSVSSGCGTKPVCTPASCPNGCCDTGGNCQNPSQNFCGQQGRACSTCFLGQVCNLGTCMSNQQAGGGTTTGGGTTGGGTTGGGGGTGGGTTGGGTTGGGTTGGGTTGGGTTGGGTTGGGTTGGGTTGGGTTGGGTTGGGTTGGGTTGGGTTGGGPTGGGGTMGCANCTTGCCNTSSGQCLSGTLDLACGTGGAACTVCSNETACVNGSCGLCDATTCPNGCCDDFGQCQTGTSSSACGRLGGLRCEACPLNASCATPRVCVATNPSGGLAGAGCTADTSCLNSMGSTGEVNSCFLEANNPGLTGGYCAPACNPDGSCIAGTCLSLGAAGNRCLGNCTGPRTGRGSCRAGTVCTPINVNGSEAPWGVCFFDCRAPGATACTTGTCNSTTGLCQ